MNGTAPDLPGLLSALAEYGVTFVVVGSVAALGYGLDVEPGDLDIVPQATRENLERLDALLVALDAEPTIEIGEWQTDGAGERVWVRDGVPREVAPRDPTDARTFDHTYGTRLGRFDIVPEVAGGYEALRGRAREAELFGHGVRIAHPLDVLTGSTRPRRDKDGPRVRQLRELLLGEIERG